MASNLNENLTNPDDKITTENKTPTKDYEKKSQEYIDAFLTWNTNEQSLFVKHLLAHMDIYQHGVINSFLSQMLRRDFIGRLSSCGLENIAEKILENLDEKTLKSAELVCREWYYVIAQGMLWKKFIERKVLTDSIWYDLSKHRGWHKYLFRKSLVNEEDNKSNEFYRSLYHEIIRDLKQLETNWYSGQYQLEKIQCESKHNKGVYCFQYDNEQVICGLRDNTIQIWNRKTLKCIRTLTGHNGSVLCLQYDDKVLITGSSDSTIRVWNIETGELVNTLLYHTEAVLHLRFIDQTMMTCSKDRSIAVWQINSPTEIILQRALVGHRAAVNVVDFDDKYIVSASGDRTIKVWKTKTFDFVRTLVGHKRGIACLQYRDQLVVSGSSDYTIRIWNIECGICLRVLEGHQELVRCVRFDSKHIISGAYDGKIKIWDLQAALDPRSQISSLCMKTFMEHSGRVFRLQFDQFQILSSSHDDTIVCFNFLQPEFGIANIQMDTPVSETVNNESSILNTDQIQNVISSTTTTTMQSTEDVLPMDNSPATRRSSKCETFNK